MNTPVVKLLFVFFMTVSHVDAGICQLKIEALAGRSVDLKKMSDTPHQKLELALAGDQQSSTCFAWGEVEDDPIPWSYHQVIAAQNGKEKLRFAQALYWSGNAFNRVRAIWWVRDQDIEVVEGAIWRGRVENGIPFQSERKKQWKDIYNHGNQTIVINKAIESFNLASIEHKVLLKHATSALNGSISSAVSLWQFYKNSRKFKLEAEDSWITYDWISVCSLYLHGFPSARVTDKYLYWVLIAAENGDPESQWQLANFHDINQRLSRTRHQFWLKKAANAGFKAAVDQLKEGQ